MLIKLQNFMCYKEKEVDFGESGLQLLKGLNGSGKSTILRAIYFALYGKFTKVQPLNTPKVQTTVELYYRDLYIKRTKTPNSLLLKWDKQEYNDDSAQFVIDDYLQMNFEQFCLSSYIRPNNRNSLATLTPTDQLRMIENFTFTTDLHNLHKTQISKMVKERKEKLHTQKLNCDNSKTIYESEMEEFKELYPSDLQPPENDFNEEEYNGLLQDKTTLEYEISEINRLLKTNNVQSLLDLKSKLEINISNIKDKLKENVNKEEVDELEDLINKKNKELQRAIQIERVEKNYEEFLKLKEAYFRELQTSKEALELYILTDQEKEEVLSKIKEVSHYQFLKKEWDAKRDTLKRDPSDVDDLPKLKKRMELIVKKWNENEENIKYNDKINNSKSIECPECKHSILYFDNEVLIEREKRKVLSKSGLDKLKTMRDTVAADIEFLTQYIDLMKTEPSPPSINESLEELNQRFEDHTMNIVKYNTLTKNIKEENLSSTLIKMRKGIPIEILKDKQDVDLEELKTQINTLQNNHITLLNKLTMRNTLLKELEDRELELTKIDKSLTTNFKDVSKDKLLEKNVELNRIQQRISNLEKNRDLYIQFNAFVNKKTKVEKLESVYRDCCELSKKREREYASALKLQTLQNQAEILSIDAVVNTINQIANDYLDLFFEDPINIKIDILKKTQKDIKFKVNTVIYYKNSLYNSYNELSQGELVRINLAYILALNKYFDSNILMLDEFLENLDSEIVCEITQKLKEISKLKLILVIDHTASASGLEGFYDNVIEF